MMMIETTIDEKLNDDLKALVMAAARFFDSAARAHREDMPEDSAAFAALAMHRGAIPGMRIALYPSLHVQVGYSYKDEWAPFFSWAPPAPQPLDLN